MYSVYFVLELPLPETNSATNAVLLKDEIRCLLDVAPSILSLRHPSCCPGVCRPFKGEAALPESQYYPAPSYHPLG